MTNKCNRGLVNSNVNKENLDNVASELSLTFDLSDNNDTVSTLTFDKSPIDS